MTEHTPGPWRIGDAGTTIFGPSNGQPAPERVASLCKNNAFRANARLIAAAPALLDDHEANRDDAAAARVALNDYLSTVTNDSRLEAAQLLMAAVSRRSEAAIAKCE